jgi:hypothetical protein
MAAESQRIKFGRHRLRAIGADQRREPCPVAIVLELTALLTVVSLVPREGAAVAGLAVFGLTYLAGRHRAPAATSLGLLFTTCLVLGLSGVGPQQVVFSLAFAIYAVVIRTIAP